MAFGSLRDAADRSSRTEAAGGLSAASERLLNRRHDFVVGGEAERSFLRDHLVADPDRKLASAAFDNLWIDASRLFDGGCRTGSTRTIISNLAESNPDVLHTISINSGDRVCQRIFRKSAKRSSTCPVARARPSFARLCAKMLLM